MAGRVTDTDVDVVQPTGSKGRVTDTDVDVVQPEDTNGRFTQSDLDVVQPDVIPGIIHMGPGGWGFIPIGTFNDRTVYIDTYEDGY